ncbi:hypothetical protein HZH68_006320 [Vespula germanica]|uniref:Uncharacterized protein n=1 Tax=Vespula germanica TaxID=30212 RepID=A0A834KD46_VESGE|nr:hypothetical protein HZH68_006320 [Vespula germanica]
MPFSLSSSDCNVTQKRASEEDLAGVDRPTRTVSLKSDRGSRTFPSLELDTVVEERSDPEQSTALELSSPD